MASRLQFFVALAALLLSAGAARAAPILTEVARIPLPAVAGDGTSTSATIVFIMNTG